MKTVLATTLNRQAEKILAELRMTKELVLISEHGKPSAYLVDVDHFEFMQNRLAILEGIARGEREIGDNNISMHDEAKVIMEEWLE
ncbi:type II toxin-antitoxin system Phd/YefM family antitoxin [Shewanella sp. 202IG2-18]|uniref:type II toxin-antitoxin system Phd/YefM family antitoxin n=1 Tax=Parashewanella hymeniacidonis TaxID=2807618 RepID=UPI0019621970|nr:type II toxin-antitoxin system prevent-host-death family antitoxin [Parashewanella hymeniacidonis]MBM7070755.1 type II toxin-antitoxin system Phd/YefM family antitoxin [Parashewanella hymeniacidonis]